MLKVILKYVVLAGVALVLCCGWYMEHTQREEELREMNEKVQQLKESEVRSVITSRMSDQLNDIAEEQKLVLDQQLEEVTVLQKETQLLLTQSEADKKAAIEARNYANAAAAEAERQRVLAETNRIEAIEAKNAADTLSFRALASSLAATSLLKQENGDWELASKLAYLAYVYSLRYNADPYDNYAFRALFSPSKMNFSYVELLGHRMNKFIELSNDSVLIVGATGEAVVIKNFSASKARSLEIESISRVPDLDYRDAIMGKNCPILLSYDGKLFEYQETLDKELTTYQLPISECLAIWDYDETRFVVIGRRAICMVSKSKLVGKIAENCVLKKDICAIGKWQGHDAFIDVEGKIFQLHGGGLDVMQEVKLPAHATSFIWDEETGTGAIGCKDGSIYLQKNGKTEILKGHSSTVSGLAINGDILYSGSYDMNAIRWNLKAVKKEPLVIFYHAKWIRSVYFRKPYLLCGLQQDGRIWFMCPDVNLLAKEVHKNITQNLTQEEWDTYIGKNVAYEKIIDTDN